MPASASLRTAARRRAGVGARGSTVMATLGCSDVTDTTTSASPFAAIGPSRSISRVTRSDLVVMVSGWLYSANTSMQPRVMRHCSSIG